VNDWNDQTRDTGNFPAAMNILQVFVFKQIFVILVMWPAFALAQTFPSRLVRIVTGGAGGGNDVVARLIAQGLTASLGQQVVVDNRPSGVIPGEVVSRSPPDGHTVLVSGSSFWILPLFQPSPYDVQKDFSPITLAVNTPNILAVHRSLPVDNVAQLIALARATGAIR
jgi:tripartite-type tricarboxylate transporter receptor subunit TctC